MIFPNWFFLLLPILVLGRVALAVRERAITIKADRIEWQNVPRLFVLINLVFCAIALALILVVAYPALTHELGTDLAGAALLASIGTVPALTAAAAGQPRARREAAAEVATSVFAAAAAAIVAGVCFIAAVMLAVKSFA